VPAADIWADPEEADMKFVGGNLSEQVERERE